MTWSAPSSGDGGIVKPSALAALTVDHKLEIRWLLDREIARLGTVEGDPRWSSIGGRADTSARSSRVMLAMRETIAVILLAASDAMATFVCFHVTDTVQVVGEQIADGRT